MFSPCVCRLSLIISLLQQQHLLPLSMLGKKKAAFLRCGFTSGSMYEFSTQQFSYFSLMIEGQCFSHMKYNLISFDVLILMTELAWQSPLQDDIPWFWPASLLRLRKHFFPGKHCFSFILENAPRERNDEGPFDLLVLLSMAFFGFHPWVSLSVRIGGTSWENFPRWLLSFRISVVSLELWGSDPRGGGKIHKKGQKKQEPTDILADDDAES